MHVHMYTYVHVPQLIIDPTSASASHAYIIKHIYISSGLNTDVYLPHRALNRRLTTYSQKLKPTHLLGFFFSRNETSKIARTGSVFTYSKGLLNLTPSPTHLGPKLKLRSVHGRKDQKAVIREAESSPCIFFPFFFLFGRKRTKRPITFLG